VSHSDPSGSLSIKQTANLAVGQYRDRYAEEFNPVIFSSFLSNSSQDHEPPPTSIYEILNPTTIQGLKDLRQDRLLFNLKLIASCDFRIEDAAKLNLALEKTSQTKAKHFQKIYSSVNSLSDDYRRLFDFDKAADHLQAKHDLKPEALKFLKLPWLKPRGFLGQQDTLPLSQWTFPALV
jgi:hypothetical protein